MRYTALYTHPLSLRDDKMVEMWDLAANEYAVLSTYVANIDQLGENLNGVHEVPHLCMVIFTSQVRTHATKCARNLPKPKLTNAVWGAGLSFSKCHAELKVPVDPHTPGIFDGEEFNRAARFWTYGYDIYTPHRVYVLHDYPGSQHNPKTSKFIALIPEYNTCTHDMHISPFVSLYTQWAGVTGSSIKKIYRMHIIV